jgi:hypothetical protein
MTPNDVVTFFGSQVAVARAIGTTSQAVNKWIAQGQVPLGRQCQLQLMTRGKLRADGPIGPRTKNKNSRRIPIDNRDQM